MVGMPQMLALHLKAIWTQNCDSRNKMFQISTERRSGFYARMNLCHSTKSGFQTHPPPSYVNRRNKQKDKRNKKKMKGKERKKNKSPEKCTNLIQQNEKLTTFQEVWRHEIHGRIRCVHDKFDRLFHTLNTYSLSLFHFQEGINS